MYVGILTGCNYVLGFSDIPFHCAQSKIIPGTHKNEITSLSQYSLPNICSMFMLPLNARLSLRQYSPFTYISLRVLFCVYRFRVFLWQWTARTILLFTSLHGNESLK